MCWRRSWKQRDWVDLHVGPAHLKVPHALPCLGMPFRPPFPSVRAVLRSKPCKTKMLRRIWTEYMTDWTQVRSLYKLSDSGGGCGDLPPPPHLTSRDFPHHTSPHVTYLTSRDSPHLMQQIFLTTPHRGLLNLSPARLEWPVSVFSLCASCVWSQFSTRKHGRFLLKMAVLSSPDKNHIAHKA